jgi:peptidoglycan/LPS O-acetylase OafA/YrhL
VRSRLFRDCPIDDAVLDGHNNFHLLRLAAALLVLLSHAFHLLARGGEEPVGRWFTAYDASRFGVAIFFFISGFLVSRSWVRRGDLGDFLIARALRIAPGLWMVLLVTVLVLGPALTTLPVADYLADPGTMRYLAGNAVLLTQYLLPGVFETNPSPGPNGSLWTIPLEVVLYLVLATCGWLWWLESARSPRERLRRIAERPLMAAALLLVASLLVSKILRTGAQYYGLAGYFLLGALCHRFRARLALRLDLTVALVAAAALSAKTALEPVLVPLAVSFAILTLALHPACRLPRTWLHRHDYSYGTYLYGFPVQQTLIASGIGEPWTLFAAAVIATGCCAIASWHGVERPCLDLKARAISVSSRIRLFRVRSP